MKPRCAPVWILALLPAVALAQSLGEAARKERERREKLRDAGGTAAPITEEDLAANTGQLANDPGAAPPAAGAGEAGGRRESEASGPRQTSEVDSTSDREEYWRGRVARARGQVEEAQARYDSWVRAIHVGHRPMYDQNGRRVIYSIHQMKAMADEAEAALTAAKAALESLLEAGRRAGALPGWLE